MKAQKNSKQLKNYLANEKKDLIKFSKEKETQIAFYKENFINVVNLSNYNSFSIKHDFLQDSKDNYLWFVYNCMLQQEEIAKDGEYVAIFLTLTLNSSFHKYSTHNNKINKHYKKENTINKGYKLLNKSFRDVYKNFKVKRKHEKIFFSKAIEPHKNLTPHLHSVIYVRKEFVKLLIKHIKNVKKNNRLGRLDIENIKDINKTTSYILKYIQKNTNPKNEEQYHFFNGWKKKNRIKVFTHSYSKMERYVFKKVNTILKLSSGLEEKNAINEVLEQCNIRITTKCETTQKIKFKRHFNANANYDVIVNRTRTISEKIDEQKLFNLMQKMNAKIVYKNFNKCVEFFSETHFQNKLDKINEESEKLVNAIFESDNYEYKKDAQIRLNYLHNLYSKIKNNKEKYRVGVRYSDFIKCFESELLTKTYSYTINNFQIIDKDTNEIIYNKKDFKLFENLTRKESVEYWNNIEKMEEVA
ncbi:replication endonuclease [Halarcobacter sp.]|uniref:replication endonuclease n=1 Tax=Halarcobacter sp. TaxID=2321133 RepID=UPI003B00E9B4